MLAIHTFWTRPDSVLHVEEYALLTMVLSALKWRELNGEIILVTDSKFKDYIIKRGISHVWNDISTELDNIPKTVDPAVFWAAGKIYGIKNQKAPFVSIDTDFIVWKNLHLNDIKDELTVIHKEDLYPDVYPNEQVFLNYDNNYNWDELPSNTAFLLIKNQQFLQEYVKFGDMFMNTCKDKDYLKPMVFVEQRMFSMIAEKQGLKVATFSDIDTLINGKDPRFTHLWGYKSQIVDNPKEKEKFTKRLKYRIKKDFKGIINF